MNLSSVTLATCLLLTGPMAAQNVLTTTFMSNNGQSGNMFDIVANVPVTINSFDVNLDAGTWNLEVYVVTGGGSYAGNETNAGAWTLIGSANGVTSNGLNVPTPLPIAVNVPVPMNATQGFYVTVTNGTSMNYTNGTAAGTVFAQDTCIQLLEGVGKAYPFGTTFTPRVWNGNIHYTGTCPAGEWQVNSPDASLDVDGAQSGGFQPAVTSACPGQIVTANLGSMTLVGNPWDLAATINTTTVPVSSGGTLLASGTQAVNLDLTHPSLGFLFGVTFTNAFAPASIPFPTAPVEVDAQLVVLNPAHADGVSLSQAAAVQPDPTALQASVPGPTADDTPLGPIDVTAPPLNCPPVGFYGTNYTQIFVNPNGRVSLTGGDSDFTPTVSELLNDPPSVGVWCDLSPNAGGAVTIGKDCSGDLVVRWSEVPYFTQTNGPYSSFDIRFEVATGFWHLENLTSVVPDPTSTPTMMLVGACPGSAPPGPGTDPGPQDYTQGAAAILNASDAIYEIGSAATYGMPGNLLGGNGGLFPITGITFFANGIGGYDWVSN